MTDRFIIHINVADFAVAVERAVDPNLKDWPVIIAPEGAQRAAVYDMSEEAFQAGVRKQMPLGRAVRMCRDARILFPHPARYEQAMQSLFKQALPCSPLIECGEGDGHLFMDVTGSSRLLGPPVDVAWRLGGQIQKAMGLTPIWSVATSKLVAKTASRLVKPVGEYIVGPGDEAAFLSPLPVNLIPGMEPSDIARLKAFNITRVFEAAVITKDQMQVIFGSRGAFIRDTMQGIDPSKVRPAGQTQPSVRVEQTFGNDTNHVQTVEGTLYKLVENAGRHLRKKRLAARRICICLDHSDGVQRIRRLAVKPATTNDFTLFYHAKKALYLAWERRIRLRRMSLFCDRLIFPPAQLSLFEAEQKDRDKKDRLVTAMDRIRERFGTESLNVGRTLAA